MRREDPIFEQHIHPLAPIPTGETPTGLSKIRHVTGVLFDVYGTLLISGSGGMDSPAVTRGRAETLAGVLRRYGIDRTPNSLSQALHRTIKDDHDRLRQEGIDHPEVDIVQIWQTVLHTKNAPWVKAFALAYELVVNPVFPMPGVKRLLLNCQERNLFMGIISNAQFYTPALLEQLLGTSLDNCGFDPHLTLFSYRLRSAKPSTFMFEQAVKTLSDRGIPPAAVLYVGNDMLNDILPAKTVGFQTALFAGDRRSLRRRTDDTRCRHLSPDVVITDLRQLIVDAHNPRS